MNRFRNAGPQPGHDIFGLLGTATTRTPADTLPPAVASDGRTPCDVCDALVTQAEAERNYSRWTLHVCDDCANETAGANP